MSEEWQGEIDCVARLDIDLLSLTEAIRQQPALTDQDIQEIMEYLSEKLGIDLDILIGGKA